MAQKILKSKATPNSGNYHSSLANEARVAMRSVVQIHAEGFDGENARSIVDPQFAIPDRWSGSGFFVRLDEQEGFLVTNAHVIRNAYSLQIMSILTSEELFRVEIVGLADHLDPDIALLRLPPEEVEKFKKIAELTELPCLEFARLEDVSRGEDVKAIGYPLGLPGPNMSGGEISNFVNGDSGIIERLVTDSAINPGNSGGPAILRGGRVVGINTSIIVDANNIGFITPIKYVEIMAKQLLTQARAELAELGGEFQKNSPACAKYFGQKEPFEGVLVKKVKKNGTLDVAGVQARDFLIGINQHRFDRHGMCEAKEGFHRPNLHDVMHSIPVGERLSLHVVRKGEYLTIPATAKGRPPVGVTPQPSVFARKYVNFEGLIIQRLTPEILMAIEDATWYSDPSVYEDLQEIPHIAITYVQPGSASEELGLFGGDLIDEIQGQKVHHLDEAIRIINKAVNNHDEKITLRTRSGGFGVYYNQGQWAQPFQLKPFGRLEVLEG